MIDLTGFVTSTRWASKDIRKFKNCTKLISRGAIGSSSANYAKHPMANTGEYDADDIVGISSNGARRDRIAPDWDEIKLAVAAGVTFVTDRKVDRLRSYNIGERLVAQFLESNGYSEISQGVWIK